MKRKCPNCNEIFESITPFCPICKKFGLIIKDDYSVISSVKFDSEKAYNNVFYDDWNPPAASSIYCKSMNVPYNSFAYNRGKGIYPTKLRQIEFDLSNGNYNCSKCSYCIIIGKRLKCNIKQKIVNTSAICKSFEPQPGKNYDKILMKKKKKKKETKKIEYHCPYCDERIKKKNKVCPNCQRKIEKM